jgi:hypothetical protein
MELHHLAEYLSAKLRVYFLTGPKFKLTHLSEFGRHVVHSLFKTYRLNMLP